MMGGHCPRSAGGQTSHRPPLTFPVALSRRMDNGELFGFCFHVILGDLTSLSPTPQNSLHLVGTGDSKRSPSDAWPSQKEWED